MKLPERWWCCEPARVHVSPAAHQATPVLLLGDNVTQLCPQCHLSEEKRHLERKMPYEGRQQLVKDSYKKKTNDSTDSVSRDEEQNVFVTFPTATILPWR